MKTANKEFVSHTTELVPIVSIVIVLIPDSISTTHIISSRHFLINFLKFKF